MNMRLSRNILDGDPDGATITVKREKGDPPAKRSGYSGDGWSMEHHFMHMVKRALASEFGIELAKVNAARDFHMVDDRLPILRPPKPRGKRKPDHNIGVYHADYVIRSAARDYNAGDEVALQVFAPYWK